MTNYGFEGFMAGICTGFLIILIVFGIVYIASKYEQNEVEVYQNTETEGVQEQVCWEEYRSLE